MAKKIHNEGESLIVSEDVDIKNLDFEKMVHKPGLAELLNEFKTSKRVIKKALYEQESASASSIEINQVKLILSHKKQPQEFDAVLSAVSLEDDIIKYSFGMFIADALEINNLFLLSRFGTKDKAEINFIGLYSKENQKTKKTKDILNLCVDKVFINKKYEGLSENIALVEIHLVCKDSK